MPALIRTNPAERRLLQEGRMAGPMPWVIAIMMFLTALATASGLALGSAADRLGADLAGRLTIQLAEADPVARAAGKQAILDKARRLDVIRGISPVAEKEVRGLLAPWLGEAGADMDLPVPVLIDIELRRATAADVAAVRRAIHTVAPKARIDEHAHWLAPLSRLLQSLEWLSAALVLLTAVATAATVVLAARGALNTHKPVIEVMHLLGSTDSQVAGLFQRRMALDAFLGGLAGLCGALGVVLLIGDRVDAIGSGLLGSARFGWVDWAILLSLPLLGALLATLAARLTILFALRTTL